jgi:ATP-binding cassette subfamily B protein
MPSWPSLAASHLASALQPVVIWILLASGVEVFTIITRSISDYPAHAQSLQVTALVADILHAQSIAVELEYYEDPGYFNTLHRAQQEASYRPTSIINGLVQLAQNGISLLGIISLLVSYNWLLALVLVFAAAPGALEGLQALIMVSLAKRVPDYTSYIPRKNYEDHF